MSEIKCIVVTPEATAFEKDVSFVVVPLFDGEFGIDKNHSPMIGRLGFGELRIRLENNQSECYYVDGGFVQVADNVVSVLTGRLIPADKVDGEAAKKHLREAMKRPANTPDLQQIRDRAVAQSRSQIRIAAKSARG